MIYINPSPGVLGSQIYSLLAGYTEQATPTYDYMAFGTEFDDGLPKGKSYSSYYPATGMVDSVLGGESSPNSRNISSVYKIPDTDVVLIGGTRYDGTGGIVLRTANFGSTYIERSDGDSVGLYGAQTRDFFHDSTSLKTYCVTDATECTVLTSSDLGGSWAVLSSFDPGFVHGSAISAVYRHTNGDYYTGVFPLSNLLGATTKEPSRIYKSTNGSTWALDHTFNKYGNLGGVPTALIGYGVNRIKYFSDTNCLIALGSIETSEVGAWIQIKNMSAGTWSSLMLNGSGATYGHTYDIIEDDDYYYIAGRIGAEPTGGCIWQYTKALVPVHVATVVTYDTPFKLDLREVDGSTELVFCSKYLLGSCLFDGLGVLDSLSFDPLTPGLRLWENPVNLNSVVVGFIRLD